MPVFLIALLLGPWQPSMPTLRIGNVNLLDKKCNGKLISRVFKQTVFGDFNSYSLQDNIEASLKKQALSFYMSYPVLPKVKETHFKIVSGIYPASDFLHKRFEFAVDPCTLQRPKLFNIYFLNVPMSLCSGPKSIIGYLWNWITYPHLSTRILSILWTI